MYVSRVYRCVPSAWSAVTHVCARALKSPRGTWSIQSRPLKRTSCGYPGWMFDALTTKSALRSNARAKDHCSWFQPLSNGVWSPDTPPPPEYRSVPVWLAGTQGQRSTTIAWVLIITPPPRLSPLPYLVTSLAAVGYHHPPSRGLPSTPAAYPERPTVP